MRGARFFPWLVLAQAANTNWYNAHNFYGDLADPDAATLTDVQQFFKTYYAPNNAVLVVTGDIDTVQTLGWIRKYFAAIPLSKLPPQPDIDEPRQEKEKRTNRDDPLVNRPALALGYHHPKRETPEFYAMGLNIREDKGYTYSPYSELSTRYRDTYWAQNADVTTAQTGVSLKEIFAEIDRLQKEPPSDAELRGIQNYLAGTYILQNSSRGGITAQLQYVDLHGLPASYPNTYVKQVYTVTPQRVTEVAKKYLQDDQATIVVVGDRKVIAEQLKAYGTIIDK